MAWSIFVLKNDVEVSNDVAKDLFEAQLYDKKNPSNGGEYWNENLFITCRHRNQDKSVLYFDPDWMEHMDFISDVQIQEVLKKHKVKGDICFGDLESSNEGRFWGYRFDGEGGMIRLSGYVDWFQSIL